MSQAVRMGREKGFPGEWKGPARQVTVQSLCGEFAGSTVPLKNTGAQARIHRRETSAVVGRRMEGQGTGWRGPDAYEMDDAGCGRHARGMLTARGSGVGSDHQLKSLAEAVRRPTRALIGQACGGLADRCKRRGRRQEGRGRTLSLARAELNRFARASPEGDAG